VEGRHHRNAREQPRDHRDEQGLEVVRMQQPDAPLARQPRHRARAAQVEPARAVEPDGREPPAVRFLRQGVASARARDRAHDG